MLDLDERVFGELLYGVDIKDNVVVDVGCGTGRHWQKLLDKQPAKLIGFDSSPGMLEKLKTKFPAAEVQVSYDARLTGLQSASCDLVISTLTIAHIEDPAAYFGEWARVLKPGGQIILTDYHPDALKKGAKRTFIHSGQTIAIRNHIHTIARIREIAGQLGLSEVRFIERKIDDSVRSYYEKQNALALFEKFKGVPIIYGIHLKKPDVTP